MEQIEQQIVKLSKINSASLINLRMNNIWINVNRYATSGKYFQWNNELDRIWCELGGDIVKDSQEEKDFKEIEKKVSEKLKDFEDKKGFDTFNDKDRKKMSEIYSVLQEKEIFLRRLQNKQGKGTAYEQGWEEYLNS